MSSIIPDYLFHFRMLGRFVAKSIIDKQMTLKLSFTKSFLKHIMNKPIFLNDLQDIDSDVERNLEWILSFKIF